MFEATTDPRTRAAIQSGKEERARIALQAWTWLFSPSKR